MDVFGVMGLVGRPWMEEGEVRRAYQERARGWHPDAVGGDAERFADLGAAYAVVRDPARRLRALADAQGGDGGSGRGFAAPTDADLFLLVGAALQRGRVVVERVRAAVGALGRALLVADVREAARELDVVGAETVRRLEEAETHLRELDRSWPAVDSEELLVLASRWERLEKWRAEIRALEVEIRGG